MGRSQNLDRDAPRLGAVIARVFGVPCDVVRYDEMVALLCSLAPVRNDPKESFERLRAAFVEVEGQSMEDVFPDLQFELYVGSQPPLTDVPAYMFSPHERLGLGQKIGYYLLKQVKTAFPPLLWLPTYQPMWLPLDLVCGLTVGVLAVSQGLAYAALAGLPPYYGLYSFLVPCFVYALFSSSRRVSFGMTTIVAILTLQTVSPFANPDTQPQLFVALALQVALYKGLFTTIMGLLRLGFIVNLLGAPVLSGFITAAGLVIASTQLRSFFGVQAPRTTDFIPSMTEWARALPTTNWPTLVIALICIVFLGVVHFVNDRWPIYIRGYRFPIPGPLLVTVFSTLACWAGNFGRYGVKLIGYIPPGMPPPSYPDFSMFSQLAVPSLIMAVICYMETIAVARKEAAEKTYKINGTHELVSQGLANLLGAFVSSPPGTGSLSRTAVVMAAGAETQIFQIVVGLVMIFVLMVASPALAYVPYGALAAIVISATYGLFEFSVVPRMWATKKLDLFCWLVTFILTLAVTLEVGILAGWGVSLVIFVLERSRSSVELLGQIPDTELFVERKRYAACLVTPGISILRFNGDLFYGNAHRLAPSLLKIAEREHARVLVIDVGAVVDIDFSAISNLRSAFEALRKAQIPMVFGRVHGKMRDFLHRTGLSRELGEENFFIALPDAVRYAKILLIDGQQKSHKNVERQFDGTVLPVQRPRSCADCCRRRKDRVELLDEMDYMTTEPPMQQVLYPAEALRLTEEDVPEHIDRGEPLTRNVHVYAHKQDHSSVARENLWWKNLI